MEVRINPQGEIVLNVTNGDAAKAIELIELLQDRARVKSEAKNRSVIGKQSQTKVTTTGETPQEGGSGNLNQVQYRTWEYLCNQDNPNGTHVSAVSKAFGLTMAAANTRLIVLVKLGYAKRVHRGYYRAETPAE